MPPHMDTGVLSHYVWCSGLYCFVFYPEVSIDAKAIYASVDLQKKELEKQARRLSKRFR